MSDICKLTEFQYVTKASGTKTTKRWQFERSAEGLLEAIRIFGATRLMGFVNHSLEQDALNELRLGSISLGKTNTDG